MGEPLENYFEFTLPEYLIESHGETTASFEYKLSGVNTDEFIVKPEVISGSVEIYDKEKNSWVEGTSMWSMLPTLSKELAVRVNAPLTTELRFRLLDTKTGNIYETSPKQVWSHSYYLKYLEEINQNSEKILSTGKLSPPQTPQGNVYVVSQTFDYMLFSFLTTSILILILNKDVPVVIKYLHAYIKKMVTRNIDVFIDFCIIFVAGCLSFWKW